MVGLLSSLGARRDRSSSPAEGRPPSKVFIQDDGKSVSQQRLGSSVPQIVVQEYREDHMLSPPLMMKEGAAGAREQEEEPQEPHQQLEQPQMFQEQSPAGPQVRKAERWEQTEEPAAARLPLSPQELQIRKAKAAKNRPWLQRPASGEHHPPESPQASPQRRRAQPGSAAQGLPQAEAPPQIHTQSEKLQKEPKRQQLERGVAAPRAEAPSAHPPQKKKAHGQPEAQAAAQTGPQAASLGPGTPPEVAPSPTEGPQAPSSTSQSRASPGQGLLPEAAIAHAQVWAQVRPSSPLQASLLGHVQPPVPAHVQRHSHPQSWAPVRPPSPKPQPQSQTAVQPETVTQPQGWYLDQFSQSQIPSMSLPQPFYPQGFYQGQSQPTSQTPPHQGYPPTVPPPWPQVGPQLAPPGSSYTQTEAPPQAAPWRSINQLQGSSHPPQTLLLQTRLPVQSHPRESAGGPRPEPPVPPKVDLSGPEHLFQAAPEPPPAVAPPHQAGGQLREAQQEPPSPPEHWPPAQRQALSPWQSGVAAPAQPDPAGLTATSAEGPGPEGASPPTLAQAPPRAYSEAYAKAQALARNGFEEAKRCLQEHIREAISACADRRVSAEQASLTEVKVPLVLHSFSGVSDTTRSRKLNRLHEL